MFELQYVRRRDYLAFRARGWRLVSFLDQSHHGVWSLLMRRDL